MAVMKHLALSIFSLSSLFSSGPPWSHWPENVAAGMLSDRGLVGQWEGVRHPPARQVPVIYINDVTHSGMSRERERER